MRINRKRRAVRTRGGLTEAQREWLLIGGFIFTDPRNGPPFASEAEERIAWNEHRDELMAEAKHNRAGSRPWAFFHWDLKVDQRRGQDELAILLEQGMVDQEEARRIERSDVMLAAAEQSPDWYPALNHRELIERQRLPPYIAEDMASKFDLAAAWHAWRGRPEIAGLYKARAEAVRSVLTGMDKHKEVFCERTTTVRPN